MRKWERDEPFCHRRRLCLRVPVFVIAEVETLVVGMEGCIEEQPHQPEMPHSLETAIRGHDMSGNDGEAAAAHFLTEKIVFSVECLFVKPTEFVETRPVEKHEHSRAEWLVQP